MSDSQSRVLIEPPLSEYLPATASYDQDTRSEPDQAAATNPADNADISESDSDSQSEVHTIGTEVEEENEQSLSQSDHDSESEDSDDSDIQNSADTGDPQDQSDVDSLMIGANDTTKRLLYGEVANPHEGDTCKKPVELKYPMWSAWQDGLPEFLYRSTNDKSHCPRLTFEENQKVVFVSGRGQWCEKTKTSLDKYHDLWTAGGRQMAVYKHLSNRQYSYPTPFVSFHDDADRCFNWAEAWEHQLITIISTRKLIELGITIIRAMNAMSEYDVYTDRPEIFNTEWLVLWDVPREAVVRTFDFKRRLTKNFKTKDWGLGGYFRARVDSLISRYDQEYMKDKKLAPGPLTQFQRKRRAEESLPGFVEHKKRKYLKKKNLKRDIRQLGYHTVTKQARQPVQTVYLVLKKQWPHKDFLKKRDRPRNKKYRDAGTQWEEPDERISSAESATSLVPAVQIAKDVDPEVDREIEMDENDGKDLHTGEILKKKVQILKVSKTHVESAWREEGCIIEEMIEGF